MFESTIERLAAAGLEMYEISNFAVPGHESRHNLAYWANDAYFGFGVGAARYLRGVRSVNTRDIERLPAPDRSRAAGDGAQRRAVGGRPGARDRDPDAAPNSDRHRTRATSEQRTGFELDALAGETIDAVHGAEVTSKTTDGESG